MTIIVETRQITGGVDTHLDTHVAAAVDANGGVLGVESFPTTTTGFAELHSWLCFARHACAGRGGGHRRLWGRPGPLSVRRWRHRDRGRAAQSSSPPRSRQVRQHRRCGGGASGAQSAAPRLWPRRAMATWRRSGCCSSPTALGVTLAPSVSTSSAISASAPLMSCGNGSVASASPVSLRPLPGCARTRPVTRVVYATKLAMQTLGRRVVDIDADCARLHGELADLVKATAPSLLDLHGVGVHTAALLLVAAGDNAERITLRGRLRPPLRGRPDPRLVRQDDPSPAQPRRQPASQPRPVAHRVHPHELGPTHPRLRRTAQPRRPHQT